MELML